MTSLLLPCLLLDAVSQAKKQQLHCSLGLTCLGIEFLTFMTLRTGSKQANNYLSEAVWVYMNHAKDDTTLESLGVFKFNFLLKMSSYIQIPGSLFLFLVWSWETYFT